MPVVIVAYNCFNHSWIKWEMRIALILGQCLEDDWSHGDHHCGRCQRIPCLALECHARLTQYHLRTKHLHEQSKWLAYHHSFGDLFKLRLFETHALWQSELWVFRQRQLHKLFVASDKMHLNSGEVVLERQQTLPHDRIFLQKHKSHSRLITQRTRFLPTTLHLWVFTSHSPL